MKSIYVFGKRNPVGSKTKKNMTVTYALGKAFSRKAGKDLYPDVSQPRDVKGAFTPFRAMQSFLQNYAKLEALYDGQVDHGGEQAYDRMLAFIMEPNGDVEKRNVKKDDGSIKLAYVHVGRKDKDLHRSRNDRRMSISGLAASWKWDRKRVRKFIEPVLYECICNYIRDRLKRRKNEATVQATHQDKYTESLENHTPDGTGYGTPPETCEVQCEIPENNPDFGLNTASAETSTHQDKSLISLPDPLADGTLLCKEYKDTTKATDWYPEDSPCVTHLSAPLQDEVVPYRRHTACHMDGVCRNCHAPDDCYMWDEWYQVHRGSESTFRIMITKHRDINPFEMDDEDTPEDEEEELFVNEQGLDRGLNATPAPKGKTSQECHQDITKNITKHH